jgi:hypothetical protein
LSIPLGASYEYPVTDEFLVGVIGEVSINYFLTEKQTFSGITSTMKPSFSLFERLHYIATVGINVTYLFTDELGISVMPTFSILASMNNTPTYFGAGGQIRFFYMFGY